ncbi:MAG: glutathione S-transferase family protein [Myxococcales bacterium]|nr:glutathione S-transferase family protein [Myxococcales bacterium]
MTTMSLTVYWGSGSPVSWRVLLALAIKNVEHQSERLNLGEKQQRSPAYLALNPRGTFPLLVAEDLRVRGSMAILNTLERMFPEPVLFGTTPRETGAIWQVIDDHNDHLAPATKVLARAFFRKDGDRSDSNIVPAREVIKREFMMLEQSLCKMWIAGSRVSAADIVLYPTIQRLLRIATRSGKDFMNEILDDKLVQFPLLAAWLERMTALPGVDSTYPPHWRES